MSKTARKACPNTDIIQERLKHLRTAKDMKWREIAALPEYSGIPRGTLCSIVTQGYIPPKWYRKLGIRKDDRPRVHVTAAVSPEFKSHLMALAPDFESEADLVRHFLATMTDWNLEANAPMEFNDSARVRASSFHEKSA